MYSTRPDPLLPVVFRLFLACWIGLWVYGWLVHGTLPTPKWYAAAKANVIGWLIGAAIGVVGMTAWVYLRRALIKHRLKGEIWRDISWSIGKFPIKPVQPASVKRYRPDISDLKLPDSVKAAPWHEAWRDRVKKLPSSNRSKPAEYIAMMEAIWRVLDFHRHVPAGVLNPTFEPERSSKGLFRAVLYQLMDWRRLPRFILDRERRLAASSGATLNPHGFSLFEHSYTTSAVMLDLAKTWTFDKAVEVWNAQRGTYLLKPARKVDKGFTFDSDDPLIPIIGLAHDIGKLRVFFETEPGVWRSNRKKHDRESALCLAAIDEWWFLHYKDKRATTTVLEAYHCARDLKEKLHPDTEDDRNFCLAMLLIEADKAALRLQGSHNPTIEYESAPAAPSWARAVAPATAPGQGAAGTANAAAPRTLTEEQVSDAVWDAFMAAMRDPKSVALANSRLSMGQRVQLEVCRPDGHPEEVPVLILMTRYMLNKTRSRLGVDIQEHFARREEDAFARTLMARLVRSKLLVVKLPDKELKSADDIWSVTWYRDFQGQRTLIHERVPSTILIAGGDLLHVGELDEVDSYPPRPFIRVASASAAETSAQKGDEEDKATPSEPALSEDSAGASGPDIAQEARLLTEQPEAGTWQGSAAIADAEQEAAAATASEVAVTPMDLAQARRRTAKLVEKFITDPAADQFEVQDDLGAVKSYRVPFQFSLGNEMLQFVYRDRVFPHYKSGSIGFCKPEQDSNGETCMLIDLELLLDWLGEEESSRQRRGSSRASTVRRDRPAESQLGA
jgi:hypothetical protein